MRQICTYIIALWGSGALLERIYATPIGYIVTGIILSKQVLGFIPYQEAFEVIGQIGLLIIVFEGGLQLKTDKLRAYGLRAFVMALIGVLLPLVFSFAMFLPQGYSALACLVAGTSLASTSIGMSLQLLTQQNKLSTDLGQIVTAAAMIDDILCLLLLSVLQKQSDGKELSVGQYVWVVILPLLVSAGFAILGMACCIVFPKAEARILDFLATRKRQHSVLDESNEQPTDQEEPQSSVVLYGMSQISEHNSTEDLKERPTELGESQSSVVLHGLSQTSIVQLPAEQTSQHEHLFQTILTAFMLVWGMALAYCVEKAGSSSLLGAYLGGVSFCNLVSAHVVWEERIAPIASWTARFCFGAIGFLIPIKRMFRGAAFGFGLIYTLLAIVAKLACALFAPNIKTNGLAIGWAMVARGELGFVIASQEFQQGIIDEELYVIVLWALFLTTLGAPFVFAYFLRRSGQ